MKSIYLASWAFLSVCHIVKSETPDNYIERGKFHACRGFISGTIEDFNSKVFDPADKKLAVIYHRQELTFSWVLVLRKVGEHYVVMRYDASSDRWSAVVPEDEKPLGRFSGIMKSVEKMARGPKIDGAGEDVAASASSTRIYFQDGDDATEVTAWRIKDGKDNPLWSEINGLAESISKDFEL